MKSLRINRRRFLRGSGVAMGLPLLEAMLPGTSRAFAQGGAVKRFLAYYVPCGIHMADWTPANTGSNYTLPHILEPLSEVKDDLLVLSGLTNHPGRPDGPGDHAGGTSAFLTANKALKSSVENDISIDQVYANAIQGSTRLPSLQLAMDGGGFSGSCDSGFPCPYQRTISWAAPNTPLPTTTDPRQAFDRLFADTSGSSSQAVTTQQRADINTSILDAVMNDVQTLKQSLGASDTAKLDEYLTGIEQLESSLTEVNGPGCAVPEAPENTSDHTRKAQLMADMLTLAFQCDATRVQSFMLGNGGSWRYYDFIGAPVNHHQASHHQNSAQNHEHLRKINRWEMQQFAYLLEKLKNTTDATGASLLDSSAVFLSSEISDGDRHNHDNMPVLLAGRAGGYFRTGRHVRYSNGESFGSLFMTMMDAMGHPISSFGDTGQNALDGLS